MKFVLQPSRIGAVLILAVLAGCGQRGPLYLPAKPAPASPPASTPAVPTPSVPTADTAPTSR